MAEITAQLVRELRERTDLPMMECKQALTECKGDMSAAVDWLRKKYKGKMEDRAGRETGEGRIGVYIDAAKRIGGIIELRCETAPVANNEMFINLANVIARRVAEGHEKAPAVDAIRADAQVEHAFTETFGRLRESMNLVRCRRVEGNHLVSYVHHDGKTGVMLALDAAPTNPSVGADLCMHTAFAKPLAIDRSGVPQAEVEKVRAMALEVAVSEGKKPQIADKIAEGKVSAFYAEKVLLEQLHARSDVYGKKKVGEVLAEHGVKTVTDMVIMKVGA